MSRVKANKPRRVRNNDTPTFWLPPAVHVPTFGTAPDRCWVNAAAISRAVGYTYAEGVAGHKLGPDTYSWTLHGWCMDGSEVREVTWAQPADVYVGWTVTAVELSRLEETMATAIARGRADLYMGENGAGTGFRGRVNVALLDYMEQHFTVSLAINVAAGHMVPTVTPEGVLYTAMVAS